MTLFLNLFGGAQAFLVVLAGLILLVEGQKVSGPDKKAAVIDILESMLENIPETGLALKILKYAAKAVAPVAIDMLVLLANSHKWALEWEANIHPHNPPEAPPAAGATVSPVSPPTLTGTP